MAHEDKLLQRWLMEPWSPGFWWVLSDSPLLERVLSRRQRELGWSRLPFSQEKFREVLANTPLFGHPPGLLWDLPPKFTEKEWARAVALVQGFHPPASPMVFLGGASLRKSVAANSPPGTVWVWYPPLDKGLLACAQVLHRTWFAHTSAGVEAQRDVCTNALEFYQGGLLDVDMHFERMARFGCTFDQALVAGSHAGAFGVVDALARGQREALVHRYDAFLKEGGEPSAVLGAVGTFLRQWVQLKAHTGDFREACRLLAIPYPAQGRFQEALKTLHPHPVLQFLSNSAHLERAVRLGGDTGAQSLVVELLEILMSPKS